MVPYLFILILLSLPTFAGRHSRRGARLKDPCWNLLDLQVPKEGFIIVNNMEKFQITAFRLAGESRRYSEVFINSRFDASRRIRDIEPDFDRNPKQVLAIRLGNIVSQNPNEQIQYMNKLLQDSETVAFMKWYGKFRQYYPSAPVVILSPLSREEVLNYFGMN